ncbi:MAG: hypothetical protein ACLQU1_28510 [Bryobacteraceae bacterium]
MFGSNILDIAIGMVFFYLLLSLICSAVNELLEGWLKYRGSNLEKGLRELLQDPHGTGLVKAFYEHPLVDGLFLGPYDPNNKKNLPSYIPARIFALVLLDLVRPAEPVAAPAGGEAAPGAAPAGGEAKPKPVPAPVPAPEPEPAAIAVPDQVRKAVTALFRAAGENEDKARANVEGWFNDSMERVSGWYKRRSNVMIFCIGLTVALLVNGDSITIASGLANDRPMRDSVVAAAQLYARENPSGPAATVKPDAVLKPFLNTFSGLGLPIGWDPRDIETVPGRIPTGWGWLLKLLGCLLTAAAVSLGAPFWFDMLNKVIDVRSSLKPQPQAAAPADK